MWPEQLSPRAGCGIHKVEMLKLADEEYPIDAERIEDVLVEACGQMPRNVGLFTAARGAAGGRVRVLCLFWSAKRT